MLSKLKGILYVKKDDELYKMIDSLRTSQIYIKIFNCICYEFMCKYVEIQNSKRVIDIFSKVII